ncbi:MAG: hypothetical protein KAT43_03480 [Nanoarchaeota archaeon]|nr:hypothetical protein [Nanoarchaeota archaeon]
MVALNWCKKQKKGIKLTEPNENLCKEYIINAEETLSILQDLKGKSNMWLATTKYYCEYFTVYALLMRLGIKSEIHDCTIELCKLLEKEDLLPKNTHIKLEKDKQLRIDNQYYLKNIEVKLNFSELTEFVLQVKKSINSLTLDKTQDIRNKIK